MNKVILLSNTEHLAQAAREWALYLHEQTPVPLVGVFLPTTHYSELVADKPKDDEVTNMGHESMTARGAIAAFQELCVQHGIDHRIHELENEHIAKTLQNETRFADLLLCCAEGLYGNTDKTLEREYLQQLLARAECPVLLVPAIFAQPKNIVLAYDGSADAVAAMKQFATTLPVLAQLEAMIIHLKDDGAVILPNEPYLEELAARHFGKLQLFKAPLNPKQHLDKWIHNQTATVLVTGAYGRRPITQLFHHSFISELLEHQGLPIFIAHR